MPRKPSASFRGYGPAHRKLRDQWTPIVEAGKAQCHAELCLMPSRAIAPDAEWDLGHNPDRTAWTGPEHARCNRAEGAARGNRARVGKEPRARRRRAELSVDVSSL